MSSEIMRFLYIKTQYLSHRAKVHCLVCYYLMDYYRNSGEIWKNTLHAVVVVFLLIFIFFFLQTDAFFFFFFCMSLGTQKLRKCISPKWMANLVPPRQAEQHIKFQSLSLSVRKFKAYDTRRLPDGKYHFKKQFFLGNQTPKEFNIFVREVIKAQMDG